MSIESASIVVVVCAVPFDRKRMARWSSWPIATALIGSGSPIHGQNTTLLDSDTVSLGTMDGPFRCKPSVAIVARSRNAWEVKDERMTSFEAQPEWRPD